MAVIAVVLARSESPTHGSAGSVLFGYLVGTAMASSLIMMPPGLLALAVYTVSPSLRRLFEKLLVYPLFGAASLAFLFLAVTEWEPGPDTPASTVSAAATSALVTSGVLVIFAGIMAANTWLTNYFDARLCQPYDHVVLSFLTRQRLSVASVTAGATTAKSWAGMRAWRS
ncbi:hypothetical protein ACFU5B_03545 [Streptomyces murinus]|uniref:hypothetical protein n=1 Tax=Streptomyces murinus TaxID=33900 RepID=UPI00364443E2